MFKFRFCLISLFLCLFATSFAFAQEADLVVTKTGPDTAAADTDVSYDVTILNIGPDTSAAITLSDPIPPGMTFVSATPPGCTTPSVGSGGTITCVIPTLAVNDTAVFTFVFHIDPQTPPGTTFLNIATAVSATDPTDENNSGIAGTSTPSAPTSDMGVLKSAPSAAPPDTDIVFTINVSNIGGGAATTVSVSDTLPGNLTFQSLGNTGFIFDSCSTPGVGSGGTITCDAASFPAGAAATLTITAHIPAGTPSGTTYNNQVTVTASNDPNPDNNTGIALVTVASGDVSVTKTGTATVTAGDNATYTIVVANAQGSDTATVNLTDSIPPGTSFVSFIQDTGPPASCGTPAFGSTTGTISCGMLLPGGISAQFTLVLEAGNTTQIVNTADVSSDVFDTDPSNNSDTATTTVTPSADLGVTKSGPPTVTAGSNVSYTITVTNSGPSDATGVSLTDSLPPDLTLVSMTQNSGPAFNCTGTTCTIATFPLGATTTFTLVAHVASSATTTPVSNTANVSATSGDPNSLNDMSSTSATLTRSADMSVVKSGPATIIAGTNITYTVTVTNGGPSDALNATMSDTTPPNTTFVSSDQTSGPLFTCAEPLVGGTGAVSCSITSFASGATAVFSIVLNVSPAATGSIVNTANTGSSTTDPDPGDNSSSSTAAVNPPPANVDIDKTVVFSPTTAIYTLTVTNVGSTDAFGTVVTDPLPPATSLQSSSASQGSCSGTTVVTCNLGTILAGNSATITLNVALTQPNGTISNTATVTIDNGDTDPSNNTATATFIAGAGAPTLSTIGMMLLALALALIAVKVMR